MNSILVLKLHGVQVSNPFKIKYNQEMNLYLYPKDYFNRISEIEEFQRNLNSSNGEYYNCLNPELLSFEIGNDRITYLITESSIDAYQDNRALIQEVHNIFELYLRLNSFIFDFFILVQKIFIFSKKKDIYHLIRIVDLNISIVKNKAGVLIYQLNSYDEEISSLFLKVNESELLQNIVKMLFEFIVSKNYSDLETRLIFTWNYLEHIAQIYALTYGKSAVSTFTGVLDGTEISPKVLNDIIAMSIKPKSLIDQFAMEQRIDVEMVGDHFPNNIDEGQRQEDKPGFHGHHPERRFILGIVNSFIKISEIKYKGVVRLPSEREGGMWLDDAILMRLGKLITAIDSDFYGFYPTYFTEKWIAKNEFKSDMVNRLEHFFTFTKGLSSSNRQIGLEALNQYRLEKCYYSRSTTLNDLEWNFVRALQTAVSNELERYIGVSELSTIFKGWDGYFRRILHSGERQNIGARTLNQIFQMIDKPITYEFNKYTYKFCLQGENLKIVEGALETYRRVRLANKKYKYIVPDNAPNKKDIEIIEMLRIAYSKHPVLNPSGDEITYNKLYKILKRDFYEVYDNKHPFTAGTVDYIISRIGNDLLYLYAPKEYKLLINVLKTYSPPKYSSGGFGNSFHINFGRIKADEFSDELIKHFRRVKKLDGQFPVDVIRHRKNYPNNWERISNFAYKITGIDSTIKTNFVKSLITTSIAGKDQGKIVLVSSKSHSVPAPIRELMKFSEANRYPLGLRSPVSGAPTHEAVLNTIMKYSKYAIASELNVWYRKDKYLLTGHIDLILKIGDSIYICDYKPLDTPFITSRISDNFINVVPQVAIYGLVVKQQYKAKNVYCITFNSEGVWIYEPEAILGKVTDFMRAQNIEEKILWDYYFKF